MEKHRQMTGKKKQLDEEAAEMLAIKRCLLFWLQPRKKPNPLQNNSPFFPLVVFIHERNNHSSAFKLNHLFFRKVKTTKIEIKERGRGVQCFFTLVLLNFTEWNID